MQLQKLLRAYHRWSHFKTSTTCDCARGQYRPPQEEDIPLALQDLNNKQIQALHPFNVHTGDYQRRQPGYQARTSFRVTWSAVSVEEKIHALHPTSHQVLMRSSESRSRHFIEMCNSNVWDPSPYEIYSNPSLTAIKCALWPHLYHKSSLCESVLEGSEPVIVPKLPTRKRFSDQSTTESPTNCSTSSATDGSSKPSQEPSTRREGSTVRQP